MSRRATTWTVIAAPPMVAGMACGSRSRRIEAQDETTALTEANHQVEFSITFKPNSTRITRVDLTPST